MGTTTPGSVATREIAEVADNIAMGSHAPDSTDRRAEPPSGRRLASGVVDQPEAASLLAARLQPAISESDGI
jgi:hypothetical protein